jgi:4-aminobutyrate aminotransferase-like enzyme
MTNLGSQRRPPKPFANRPRRDAALRLLQRFESPNVTFLDPDGSWPIVWQRARGAFVWDADGRRYLDLTAAFGVAAAGHANVRVTRAGARQMAILTHAMGDVHPHELKGRLARMLSRLTFERWQRGRVASGERGHGKTIFCNSGFEAVEAAMKTAVLATGKPGIIAFEGAYHGLGYGTLAGTHRDMFRHPFREQLRKFGSFAPWPLVPGDLPRVERMVRGALRRHRIGAVLVEPVQGRGGMRPPPAGFLRRLRRLCDDAGALLVADEIYTGFGRTGYWFGVEREAVTPDLICLGKALTGGFPLSACVGRAGLMDAAWPMSSGEAIHTSTYLGHPVGCAMALAQIEEIRRLKLVARSARLGRRLLKGLAGIEGPRGLRVSARGMGLMAGLEITRSDGRPAEEACLRLIKRMMERGFLVLPDGEHGNVVGITPPLVIAERGLEDFLRVLGGELSRLEPHGAASGRAARRR